MSIYFIVLTCLTLTMSFQNETISHVIKTVLGEDSDIKDGTFKIVGDIKRPSLERVDFKAWYNDNFNLSCSKIAERLKKINERLTKYTSADILACIKFESVRQDTNTNRQCNKWGRRMQFSTGASISLDNLIQCGSDHQIQDCDSNRNRSATDYRVFPEESFLDAIISVSPRKQVSAANNANLVQQSASVSPWKDNLSYYDSPFDNRLSFNGLADLFLPPTPASGDQAEVTCCSGPETFNCLIESDCPTAFTNNYLAAHRRYIRQLVASPNCHNTTPSILSPTSDSGHCRKNDNDFVPDFVGESNESRQLWSRVQGTRSLWTVNDTDILSTYDEANGQVERELQPIHVEPQYIRGFTVDVQTADELPKSDFKSPRTTGDGQVSENCLATVHSSPSNDVSTMLGGSLWSGMTSSCKDEMEANRGDKLDNVPQLADMCTAQFPVHHGLADGGVTTTCWGHTDTVHAGNVQAVPKCDITGPENSPSWNGQPEMNTRVASVISSCGSQRPLMKAPAEVPVCSITTQVSCSSAVTKSLRQPIQCAAPAIHPLLSLRTSAERTQFPHQSSVFWTRPQTRPPTHHQGQLPQQTPVTATAVATYNGISEFSEKTPKSHCLYQQPPPPPPPPQRHGQRVAQQYQQPPPVIQQQTRHSAPVLVQNQYGTYVNQSQQQNTGQFKQFTTPSNLYGHQQPTKQARSNANLHARAPYSYSTPFSQQNTYNGGHVQNAQCHPRQMTVDDEVWYINGVPHYHTRPSNQYEAVPSRVYGRQDAPPVQPRPWSVAGSAPEVRLVRTPFFAPPPALPPPPVSSGFQPLHSNSQAHWNVNCHNAGPPPPVLYPGNEICVPTSGDVTGYHLNRNTNNNNQLSYGSCLPSDDVCRASPADDSNGACVTVRGDLTNKVEVGKENHITVLGSKMRLEDERSNKKKKHKTVRPSLVRIV